LFEVRRSWSHREERAADDEQRTTNDEPPNMHLFTQIALHHYLAVGAIMFALGLIGFLTRRNLIILFLCTELMFQGVAITLIAFGAFHQNLAGQAFVIFMLVIAAAEASLALGLVVLLFRTKHTVDSEAWRTLRG
jgi:NADH-quinone oxidoreductase subunit K